MGADETLEFGVRVQRGPPRGSDPTAVFPVATSEEHLAIVWDHVKLGNAVSYTHLTLPTTPYV